jgi:hypothetical protein
MRGEHLRAHQHPHGGRVGHHREGALHLGRRIWRRIWR